LDARRGVSFSLGAELRRWAWLIAASRRAASLLQRLLPWRRGPVGVRPMSNCSQAPTNAIGASSGKVGGTAETGHWQTDLRAVAIAMMKRWLTV